MPTQATIDAHYAQAIAPMFLPSNTGGEDIELMDLCMIPLMWALYFIGGGTPKATLDKIELMVTSVAPGDRGLYKFISQWGRYACVASGPFGAEISIQVCRLPGRISLGELIIAPGPKEGSMWSTAWQVLRPLQLRQPRGASICEWLKQLLLA